MFSFFGKNHFEQGKEALEKGDWEKAIKEFSAELEKNSQNADAYAFRARAYLSKQDLQSAFNDATAAIRLNNSHEEAHLVRGILRTKNLNQVEDCIADFTVVLQRNPNNHEALAYRGNAYNILNNPQKSLEELNRAIQLNPNIAVYYGMRAAPRGALGDFMGVVADTNRAMQMGRKTAIEYMLRGAAYRELKLVVHAAEDFRAYLALEPSSPQAPMLHEYIELVEKNFNGQRMKAIKASDEGLLASWQGDFLTAEKHHSEAIKLDSQFAPPYSNRAASLVQQGKFPEALKDLNKALELDANFEDALVNRAVVLANLNRFEEALVDGKKATSLYPNSAGAYTRLGQIYKIMKDYPQSIEACNRALEIDSNHAEAYYFRGLSYVIIEEDAKAIADLEKCLALGKDYGRTREILVATRMKAPKEIQDINNRGIAEAQKGNMQVALAAFNEAIQKYPSYSGAYGNRGNVYRLSKRVEEALHDYDKAIELEPLNADALFGRAMSFVEKNPPDFPKAIDDFTAFLKLRPDMGFAYRMRAMAFLKVLRFAEAQEDFQRYMVLDKAGYMREQTNIDAFLMVIREQLRQKKS